MSYRYAVGFCGYRKEVGILTGRESLVALHVLELWAGLLLYLTDVETMTRAYGHDDPAPF